MNNESHGKDDWKKEYMKVATVVTNDMVGMVKHSQLTEKMENGMKKLKRKVEEKKKSEEKQDVKSVAKKSWSWLASKTKGALSMTVNATKTYINDIKEEFGPKAK